MKKKVFELLTKIKGFYFIETSDEAFKASTN